MSSILLLVEVGGKQWVNEENLTIKNCDKRFRNMIKYDMRRFDLAQVIIMQRKKIRKLFKNRCCFVHLRISIPWKSLWTDQSQATTNSQIANWSEKKYNHALSQIWENLQWRHFYVCHFLFFFHFSLENPLNEQTTSNCWANLSKICLRHRQMITCETLTNYILRFYHWFKFVCVCFAIFAVYKICSHFLPTQARKASYVDKCNVSAH